MEEKNNLKNPLNVDNSQNIQQKINDIFENNKINDLKDFLSKRQFLNGCNLYLIYLFNIVQTSGILTTSIGTSYNITSLIWIGIGLNSLATLIHIFEKTNTSISKKYMLDINLIKDNNYIDQGEIIDESNKI